MLGVELEVAALHPRGGRDIGLAAFGELGLRHQELKLARRKVDLDLIAIADEANDAAARGFRCHIANRRSVRRAAMPPSPLLGCALVPVPG